MLSDPHSLHGAGEEAEDINPLLQAGEHDIMSPTPETLDYDQVLLWTPQHVAAWLNKIGLGQYKQAFVDKGTLGYMLFDFDGHKLKVRLTNTLTWVSVPEQCRKALFVGWRDVVNSPKFPVASYPKL